ncbi:MAG: hypothetical protein ACE5JM_00455, partial [Armatimonadota bacterium]
EPSHVWIAFAADGQAQARVGPHEGERMHLLTPEITKGRNSLDIELAAPWRALGIRPRAGGVMGFDVFWTDADNEDDQRVAGTLRWAGCAREMGYLLLDDR